MDEKDLELLHKAVSSQFDIGDFNTFKSKMQTVEDRKSFYDVVENNGYDIGDYNDYEKRLSKNIKNTEPTSTFPKPTISPIPNNEVQKKASIVDNSLEAVEKANAFKNEDVIDKRGEIANLKVEDKQTREQGKAMISGMMDKGINPYEIADALKGVEVNDVDKAKIEEGLATNPKATLRGIARSKYQNAIKDKAQEIIATDPKRADEVTNALYVAQDFLRARPDLTHDQQREGIKEGVKAIRAISDNPDELVKELSKEAYPAYFSRLLPKVDNNGTWARPQMELNPTENNYQAQGLSNLQTATMHYLEDMDYKTFSVYKPLLVPQTEEQKNDVEIQLGTQERLLQLDRIGYKYKIDSAIESRDKFLAKGDKEKADIFQLIIEGSIEEEKHLEDNYPLVKQMENRSLAKDLENFNKEQGIVSRTVSNTGSALSRAANIVATAGYNTVEGIIDLYPFRSKQEDAIRELSILGSNKIVEDINYLPQNERVSIEYKYAFDLKAKNAIEAINNSDLSKQEKIDAIESYKIANENEIRKIPVELEDNTTFGTVFQGVADMASNLTAYMATSTGLGAAGVGRFGSELLAGFATMFHESLANNLAKGVYNPYGVAARETGIVSLAMAGASTAKELKEMATGVKNVAIKDAILNMSDKALQNSIDATFESNAYKALSIIKDKMIASAKSSLKINAVLTPANVINQSLAGDEINIKKVAKDMMHETGKMFLFEMMLGVGGAIKRHESVNELQKVSLFDAASRPEAFKEYLDKQLSLGKITDIEHKQLTKNVDNAAKVFDNLPLVKGNGKKLTDTEARNLLYLKVAEANIESTISKDIPIELQEKLQDRLARIQDQVDATYKGTYIKNVLLGGDDKPKVAEKKSTSTNAYGGTDTEQVGKEIPKQETQTIVPKVQPIEKVEVAEQPIPSTQEQGKASNTGEDVEFTAYRFGGEGKDGITFSSKNKDYSEEYATIKGGKAEDVREVKVKAKNPITIDLSPKEFSSPTAEKKYIDEAKKNGNDLVIFRDKENGDEFYAQIEQSQYKQESGDKASNGGGDVVADSINVLKNEKDIENYFLNNKIKKTNWDNITDLIKADKFSSDKSTESVVAEEYYKYKKYGIENELTKEVEKHIPLELLDTNLNNKDTISGITVFEKAKKAGSENNDFNENMDDYKEQIENTNYVLMEVPIDKLKENDEDLAASLKDIDIDKSKRRIESPIIIGTPNREAFSSMDDGVIDGFHRVEQAVINGDNHILAYVPKGSKLAEQSLSKTEGVASNVGVEEGSGGVGKPSSEKTELYNVPILLDPKAKVRGDKQEYITREVFDRAFEKDDREGINFQTAETLIRRGGYSTEELNKLLPNWRELLPKEQPLKETIKAEAKNAAPSFEEVKPKKRQEKINDLLDMTTAHNKIHPNNKKERLPIENEINILAKELGLAKDKTSKGYIIIKSANNRKVQKRNVTKSSENIEHVDTSVYSENTNQLISIALGEHPHVLTDLYIEDSSQGRKMTVKQIENAMQAMRLGKTTQGVKDIFDAVEKMVSENNVETLNTLGLRDKTRGYDYGVDEWMGVKPIELTKNETNFANTISDGMGDFLEGKANKKFSDFDLNDLEELHSDGWFDFPFDKTDYEALKTYLHDRESITEPSKGEQKSNSLDEPKGVDTEGKNAQEAEIQVSEEGVNDFDKEIDALNKIGNKSVEFSIIPKSVKDWVVKNLTSNKGFDKMWMAITDLAKGERLFAANQIKTSLTKLSNAINTTKYNDIDAISKALQDTKSASFLSLPIEVKKAVVTMRSIIDGYSQSLVNNGYVTNSQALEISQNIGNYLNRAYKLHTDKKYTKNIDPIIFNDAVVFLSQQNYNRFKLQVNLFTSNADMLKKSVELAKQQATDIITKKEQQNGLNINNFSKDLSTLIKREDIPEPIRKLMGEYTDPATQFAITISKLATMHSQAKLLHSLKDKFKGELFFEKDEIRPEGFNYEVAGEGSQSLNPLNGLYTNKDVIDFIQGANESVPLFIAGYQKFLGVVKKFKTVYSPATQTVNFVSNAGVALSNGHFNGKHFKTSFEFYKNEMFSSEKAVDGLLKTLLQRGVIGQSIDLGQLNRMIKSNNATELALSEFIKPTYSKYNPIGILKKIDNIFKKQYGASDSFWKAYGFMNEANGLSNAIYGKSYKDLKGTEKEKIDIDASERIKNTYPTFDRTLPALMALGRNVPGIGNFMAYNAEVLRTTKNNISYALNDIKDTNPSIKAMGYKRLAGALSYVSIKQGINYMAVLAGGHAVSSLWSAIFDNKEKYDKRNDLDYYVPSFLDTHNLMVKDNGNGKYSVMDIDRLDPYNYLWQSLNAIKSKDGGIGNIAKELVEPYIEADMVLNAVTEVIANKNFNGYPIYNTADTKENQYIDKIKHVYKAIEPSAVKLFQRIDKSENKGIEILTSLLGGKTYEIDISKSLKSKISSTEEMLSNNSYFAYFKSSEKEQLVIKENLKRLTKELHEEYVRALRLGLSQDTANDLIDERLKRVKGGKDVRDMVKTGIVDDKDINRIYQKKNTKNL